MDLSFIDKYKSLNAFNWTGVPKLAIITGLNGAGKSQLLERIFALVNSRTARTKDSMVTTSKSFTNPDYISSEVIFLKGEWQLNDAPDTDLATMQTDIANYLKSIKQNNLDNSYHRTDPKLYHKLREAVNSLREVGIATNDITSEQLREVLEKSTIPDHREVVRRISQYFYGYRMKYLDLKIRDRSHKEIQAEIGAMPWDVLREIIREAKLGFEINDPGDLSILGSYKFKITKIGSGEVVKFEDLSSGERVLFSLAFLTFNSQEAHRFPKLLLLDEPDAHLHPSMTAELLKVLKNVLADKFGVQVIMTTHSPSAVAIAGEESLFLMKAGIGGPEPVSKDQAIKSLLAGIPNLYVGYENRRQVFVESENDVAFYDKLYKKFYLYFDQEVNLNFISSGDSATDKNKQPIANCEQVVNITELLRGFGNSQVYGIVDYDDGKYMGKEGVTVLGNGNRYSIESYLFDSVLVGMLMLREKIVTPDEVGVPRLNYNDTNTHTKEHLQALSDYVVDKLFRSTVSDLSEVMTCLLLNGLEVEVPKAYLMYNGHKLEELLINTFNKLGGIKGKKEAALKLAVIEKVIDDFPALISVDIIDALKEVQK